MYYTDVTSRVAAGAAKLDEVMPGWHNKINLQILNVGSSRDCVLGQLFGRFWAAPLSLQYSRYGTFAESAASEELSRNLYLYPTVLDEEYTRLTEAWKKLILARREAETLASLEQELASVSQEHLLSRA